MCFFWYAPPCIPVWSPPVVFLPPPVYVPPVYVLPPICVPWGPPVPWAPPVWPVYPPVVVTPPATKSYGFHSAEAPDALLESAPDAAANSGDGFDFSALEVVGSADYADYAIT